MSKRIKTKYPGVYFREAQRAGGGKEKVYYIVFKQDGKVIEEKVGRQFQDDMTPARAAGIRADRIEGRRKSRKELQAEVRTSSSAWTIALLWDEYKKQRASNKGLLFDDNRFKLHIEPTLGSKRPIDLTTSAIDKLRVKLERKRAPQTVKHVLALLKRIIRFGETRGLCEVPEPGKLHIEMPKVDNSRTEDLTPDQFKRLLKAIDEDPNVKIASLMKMALFTGMRRGELCRLQWGDVDFERGFILIRESKGGKSQSIPLNGVARGLLDSVPRTGSPYVFPGREGNQLSGSVYPTVRRIREKAGLPKDFRPLHGLRHAYASMLASSGEVDMYTLQKLLTHKSPVMTQRYAHLRDEALQRAAGTADNIFNELTNRGTNS